MGYRIHSTHPTSLTVVYATDMASVFDDDEMSDVEAGLVLDDGGNLEAFVIQGTSGEIRKLAHRILDALPLELTESELRYIDHICETDGYDRWAIEVSRDREGIAWAEPVEDTVTYDVTNELQRSRSVEED